MQNFKVYRNNKLDKSYFLYKLVRAAWRSFLAKWEAAQGYDKHLIKY